MLLAVRMAAVRGDSLRAGTACAAREVSLMPIFQSGLGNAPSWCEVEAFELVPLKEGESRLFKFPAPKEAYIVCRGLVEASARGINATLVEGSTFEAEKRLPKGVSLKALSDDVLICRLMGHWRSITSSGVFPARAGTPPARQTPHDYEKTVAFDNHYHDCDEYWVFFEGRCRVASEGKLYEVGPGDCVATGMGWHHDVISVDGDVKAVWFEGPLEGAGRVGHLWEPVHGKARPKAERV